MELRLDEIGHELTAPPFTYTWRDCATFALGLGAGVADLNFTWEGAPGFSVYPSFAVVPTLPLCFEALKNARADWTRLVHGAQTIRLHRPLPTAGTLRSTGRIARIEDKGKGAVVVFTSETSDGDGAPLFDTEWSIFCRGQGGFGGPRGESPALPEPRPDAAPAFTASIATRPEQALLYRLSGDINPLHVDPALAERAGFPRPILHGLCTYGMALKAAIEALADGQAGRVASFAARFAGVVFPGDTLSVRAVPSVEPDTWLLEAHVDERAVLSHGVLSLR